MKKIAALVKPSKPDQGKDALHEVGAIGMTVNEIRGFGRQNGHPEVYRGAEHVIDFSPKIKVEIVLGDALGERPVHAVQDAARAGKIGDGKVLVLPLILPPKHAVRIRTGEQAPGAA